MNQKNEYLCAILSQQQKPRKQLFRCPQCGKDVTPEDQFKPSLYFPVMICHHCKLQEELLGNPIPLRHWWMFRVLDENGDLPERYGTGCTMIARELYLSDEDPNVVEATFECWFDTESKFDIQTKHFPRFEFINLYADYHVFTGELTMHYTVVSDLPDVGYAYIPTPAEKLRIIANMEAACIKENGETMAAMVLRMQREERA